MLNPCLSIDPYASLLGLPGRAGAIARLVTARQRVEDPARAHACRVAYIALCYGTSAARARRLYLDALAQ